MAKIRVIGLLGTLFGVVALSGIAGAQSERRRPPTDAQVASAQRVSDLMLNELLAALFTEFDETTPENADEGKQAISLIFDDANRSMRLVGTFAPLQGGANDRPADQFERTALGLALSSGTPTTAVERVNETWLYRRSIPLSNTFHANCVVCHANFTPAFFERTNNPGEWVGTPPLAIPIRTGQSPRD